MSNRQYFSRPLGLGQNKQNERIHCRRTMPLKPLKVLESGQYFVVFGLDTGSTGQISANLVTQNRVERVKG